MILEISIFVSPSASEGAKQENNPWLPAVERPLTFKLVALQAVP